MFRPTLKTAPSAKPINLPDAKIHARVDHFDDDIYIEGLVDAAIARVDGFSGILGRCLITQTWTQAYPSWGSGLRLPFPNVQSVVITYRDGDDTIQTLPADHYELVEDMRGGLIVYRDVFSTPSLNDDRIAPISIDITSGYGDEAENVPMAIRHALYLLVSHWYENRAAVSKDQMHEMPESTHALLAPYRRIAT